MLSNYQQEIQAAFPNAKIESYIHHDEHYYNLVVTLTSDKKQTCFISNSCLSVIEALQDMPAKDVIKWAR